MLPKPLPKPTREEVRATGWSGDVTRFPLTWAGLCRRMELTGGDPRDPPNAAWYYAPNGYVRDELNLSQAEDRK